MHNITHTPVLLQESIQSLNITKNGFYIDGTFGQGGHSKLILSKLNKHGKLLAIDRDIESIHIGSKIHDPRFTILHGLFSEIYNYLFKKKLLETVHGIILDLGVSSLQIHNPKRGFSFQNNGPLDMRMNNTTGKSAKNWLNYAKKKDIALVFKKFGEEKFYKKITTAIIKKRINKPIIYTTELAQIILQALPKNKKKIYKKHPATKCFQAIRIFINNELSELQKILTNIFHILIPGGRLAIISFHSLEMQIIKTFIQKHTNPYTTIPNKIPLNEKQILQKHHKTKKIKVINILTPTKQEIMKNPQARSAKLYTIEKISL
ncbi:MAG: 16S rRNA m(4)C1402 methyltransferase [Candidatus Westeberhardia cardiocondylae]|nr:16S rRNA m(4)C1402 methyltransferase [Candidatus Westeberhardia cardiocondylae]